MWEHILRDSTTYQGIIDDGRKIGKLEGAKELLLRQARKRFRRPDPAGEAALDAIANMARLVRLGESLANARSWAGWLRKS